LRINGFQELKDRVSADVFLRRPEVNWGVICGLGFSGESVSVEVQEQIEIQVKYEGYIRREAQLLDVVRKNDSMEIPLGLDFSKVSGLSNEVKGRLKLDRPQTIGQASRMKGLTPAAIANLLIHIKVYGAGRSNG